MDPARHDHRELRRLRHRLRRVRRHRRHSLPHALLGRHRRRHASSSATPTGIAGAHDRRLARLPPARRQDARLRQPEPLRDRRADGEDRFNVYYLQTMNVAARPHADARRPGRDGLLRRLHDRQPGLTRNYVINVLDTGDECDGVDELAIYGREPTFNGGPTRDAPSTRPTTSSCCAPRSASTPAPRAARRPPRRPTGPPTSRCSPAAAARRSTARQTCAGGNDLDCYRDTITGNEPSAFVQRINYDTALNGRLTVYGRGGNDAFFTDDTSAIDHARRRRRRRQLPDRPDLRLQARRRPRAASRRRTSSRC